MAKTFSEVLPGFQPSGELEAILKWAQVKKVGRSHMQHCINLYLSFERLIPKNLIYKLEDAINQQFFADSGTELRIKEDFELSDQYTVSYLMEQYKDSILMELERYSHILSNMFGHAQIDYPDEDTVRIEIEDSMVAREKSRRLEEILLNIINKRFHRSAVIRIVYHDKPASRKEEKESFIEIETRRIVAEAMNSRPSAAGDDEILTLETVAGGDAAAFENMIDENPDLAGGRMSTAQALGEEAAAVLTRREAGQTAASSEGISDRPASVFMTDKTGAAKNKADKDSAQGKQGKISEGS
ncbi:MAG: hypothetical protein II627_04970, partial [Lachnospiraceae bacterium]|nr:hypothetical protein [Lachnospiraceae bacterium]